MAFSENLASFDHWNFRPSLTVTDSWISGAFSREIETLTKALQQSLSSAASETVTDNKDSYLMNLIIKPDPSLTGSGSDHDASSKCQNNPGSNCKTMKRKSSAMKRTPTTFITADSSNFRQMVQQVTGIPLGNSHVPVNHVLKSEPQRPVNRIQNCSLPTHDTSTFFMETNNNHNTNQRQHLVGPTTATQAHVSFEQAAQGGVGLDFGTFQSFPTLESWRLM